MCLDSSGCRPTLLHSSNDSRVFKEMFEKHSEPLQPLLKCERGGFQIRTMRNVHPFPLHLQWAGMAIRQVKVHVKLGKRQPGKAGGTRHHQPSLQPIPQHDCQLTAVQASCVRRKATIPSGTTKTGHKLACGTDRYTPAGSGNLTLLCTCRRPTARCKSKTCL